MIIYSVIVSIQAQAEAGWCAYMLDRHIPEVLTAAGFASYTFQKLVEPVPEEGVVVYNIRYVADSIQTLRAYQATAAAALQADHTARFGGQVTARREVWAA